RVLADRLVAQLHPGLLLWSGRSRHLDGALCRASCRGSPPVLPVGEPTEPSAAKSDALIRAHVLCSGAFDAKCSCSPSVSSSACYLPMDPIWIRTIAEDP